MPHINFLSSSVFKHRDQRTDYHKPAKSHVIYSHEGEKKNLLCHWIHSQLSKNSANKLDTTFFLFYSTQGRTRSLDQQLSNYGSLLYEALVLSAWIRWASAGSPKLHPSDSVNLEWSLGICILSASGDPPDTGGQKATIEEMLFLDPHYKFS